MPGRTPIDCLVIGAGPAGLATSAALTAGGVDHVVLERGRPGQTWRTQRWKSLRLNNPGWMNPMLGAQPYDTYLSAGEVVERLTRLAEASPVREDTPVVALSPHGHGWSARTGDAEVRARTVVVAGGGENVPRTSALARHLPERVAQLHAADYRSPDRLPGGAALVVGSAQSGYQIAEELSSTGRAVYLATSPVGRAPARHRGRDTVEWLVDCGFFDQRPEDLPDPSVIHKPQPLFAPGGRGASLQALARAGVTLAGRLVDVAVEQLTFDASVPANIASADDFAARIRAMLDEAIARSGHPVPPVEYEEAGAPLSNDPPTRLHLRERDITSVVWCTGYTGDFSWLDRRLTDQHGQPRRRGTAANLPGLWYVGLRWLTRRSSGNFLGFPTDASTVADAVVANLARGRR